MTKKIYTILFYKIYTMIRNANYILILDNERVKGKKNV